MKENEYIVTVWNTSEMKISGTATVEFNFPVEEDFENFAVIDEQAEELFSRLVKQIAEREGVTEQLKAGNQLEWVQKMNSIRNRAVEIVNTELIYM